MFQAELRPARLLKQIIEALKEVVAEVQFECTDAAITVQAMDSSHVSLVSLELNAEKFQSYRCEKPLTLGVNVGSLAKMLKCAANDDSVTLTADDDGDTLRIRLADAQEERVSEFSMKLIEIDGDALGIPQQEFAAAVQLPSAEFARICKDVANFGDTVTIDVKKEGVSFAAQGDIGTGRLQLKASREVDAVSLKKESGAKKEEGEVKKEGDGSTATKPDGEKAAVNDDDDGESAKKRRKKDDAKDEEKKAAAGVRIECKEPVTLQFALRYLTMFSRAQSVSDTVRMRLSKDVPLQMEYEIAAPDQKQGEGAPLGTLRYYLAPKVGDDADDAAPADDE